MASKSKRTKSKKSEVPVRRTRKTEMQRSEGAVPVRTGWDPFGELRTFRDRWDDMAKLRPHPWLAWPRDWPSFRDLPSLDTERIAPSTDVYRENNSLIVKADLPGMTKSDVEVRIDDGHLVVSGERQHEETKEERNYYRSERSYGSFYRRVPLPEGTDPDAVTAQCSDGVLEVHVPLPEGTKEGAKRVPVS